MFAPHSVRALKASTPQHNTAHPPFFRDIRKRDFLQQGGSQPRYRLNEETGRADGQVVGRLNGGSISSTSYKQLFLQIFLVYSKERKKLSINSSCVYWLSWAQCCWQNWLRQTPSISTFVPPIGWLNWLISQTCLWAAFMCTDSKSKKKTKKSSIFFVLLGSICAKAACKMLVKLTSGVNITNILLAVFMREDHKGAKRLTLWLYFCWDLLGSALVKAAHT